MNCVICNNSFDSTYYFCTRCGIYYDSTKKYKTIIKYFSNDNAVYWIQQENKTITKCNYIINNTETITLPDNIPFDITLERINSLMAFL